MSEAEQEAEKRFPTCTDSEDCVIETSITRNALASHSRTRFIEGDQFGYSRAKKEQEEEIKVRNEIILDYKQRISE